MLEMKGRWEAVFPEASRLVRDKGRMVVPAADRGGNEVASVKSKANASRAPEETCGISAPVHCPRKESGRS
jgi:hypothetical protein